MSKVLETRNYGMFALHNLNRDVDKITKLEKSMKANGWIPAYPMHVVREGGHLKIKGGHHRFEVAKKLGIPVKYVVCDDKATIHELEDATTPWDWQDHLTSHVRNGNVNYLKVKKYQDETGIPLTCVVSMLGGNTAGSGNHTKAFKSGTFKVKDTAHLAVVADLVAAAKSAGFNGATNRNFVIALSKVAKADGLDLPRLKSKMTAHPYLFQKCTAVDAYLAVLEEIYNRKRSDKVPLAFIANAAARERNAVTSKHPGKAA
ncbi:ParB domain protein nuclease [Solidesulfovibrio carbinoliphilus subsp. oakridgensis]|uniref:ParB domain protein nuclease n=1 Tax=Solidesulfovibrio carbinoliphilus subsp. oakridgensis TaxID=694327 RepID=G7QC60_9BACT|nr:ParB/RepB/Spo0J family partition protein [Solidesulfovibrio carbinoliphilus]EHJ49506.1 ParB domain protein nuclease [Solidesulfovibrio carbinoliphilus subsp. oakridgensis]